QTELPFFTTFYFEDAIGNRDTIWVGGHEDASAYPDMPDEIFGERHRPEPFDAVFEVRGIANFDGNGYNQPALLTDSLFLPFFYAINDSTVGSIDPSPSFVIHAKHPPVQISWDQELWGEDFQRQSAIMHSGVFEILPLEWYSTGAYPDSAFACMSLQDSLVTNFEDYGGFQAWSLWSVSGSSNPLDTLATINTLVLGVGADPSSPCPFSPSSIQEHYRVVLSGPKFFIYPNPAIGFIQILSVDPILSINHLDEVILYDLSGVEVKSWLGKQEQYMVHDLPPGMYIVQLQVDGRIFERHRVVLR
ncbi:MAG: T9SS type A sorting domain-containing protein, partial [Bacteroidota bacterium]